MKRFTFDDIMGMEKVPRLKFINSIPGFKAGNLIGTTDGNGNHNLAVFSSVIHLGSNPPFLGFICRPTTVPRHTWKNIQKQKYYTINHIHEDFYDRAHQTSAKYEEHESEFEQVGLTPETGNIHPAPYVKESAIKIGMEYVEDYHIKVNDTILCVGKIIEILIPDDFIKEDHTADLSKARTVAISGLEVYHSTSELNQLGYAKPGDEEKLKTTPVNG